MKDTSPTLQDASFLRWVNGIMTHKQQTMSVKRGLRAFYSALYLKQLGRRQLRSRKKGLDCLAVKICRELKKPQGLR